MEKAIVKSQIDIAIYEKNKTYGQFLIIGRNPGQGNQSKYNEINTRNKFLEKKLIAIEKIAANNALYDTLLENLPQAIVCLCFCIASLEHSRIQVLLTGSLASLFGVKSWSFITVTIASMTIFALISSVLTTR